MKRIITLLFSVTIFSAWTFAQPASKFNFSLALKLKNENIQNSEIAVFVQGDVNAIREKTAELGGVFKYSAGNIAAIRLPLNKVKSLSNLASVTRIENYDLKLQPMNDQVIIHNHAWEVQQGFNLPQGYDGSHVVIGIIDEGIDFTHPDFRNANGTTRIKYVWDQTYGPTAMSPQPYGYGREWKGSQIDTTVMHHDGSSSHGSHVAGIAAGNGLALNNYKGIAPNADIIVVKMNLNVPDNNFLTSLVDAVRYVFEKADSLNEPASINVSLGTYFGSHDGRDIQTIMIDTLISGHAGRSLTCAAGNAGSAPIHIGYNVTSDTSFTWLIAPYSPSTNNQVYVELWGDSANFTNVQFAMGIDRVQPAITSLAGIPFSTIQTNLGIQNTYTLYSGSNRLGIVETQGEYLHGAYTMAFLITPDSATSVYRWRLMTKGSGHLDGWSLDMVADNLPDSSVYPSIVHYKRPDLDQNIASSFTCSDKVITVGSYVNRNSYSNSIFAQTIDTTLVPGKLSAFSSHGPTRDGRIKPRPCCGGTFESSRREKTFQEQRHVHVIARSCRNCGVVSSTVSECNVCRCEECNSCLCRPGCIYWFFFA
ncbi:MAG: S8 family serine peptidase [Bacteroidetes bacterium]|nr:S8 family serine peptidase [Bacteroidota bacterium]